MDFPPHQLMESAQNNFSPQPQYRPPPPPPAPQVFIETMSAFIVRFHTVCYLKSDELKCIFPTWQIRQCHRIRVAQTEIPEDLLLT